MPTLLTSHAAEESTYAITAAFTDEAGDAVAPDTLTWTLTNDAGTVINNREDETVDSPASSETIVLSGNDLAVGGNGVVRILTIKGTYTSSLGSELPLTDQVTFIIDDFTAIT